MTTEEAIEILKPFKACMFDQYGCPISDAAIALDVAIESLKQNQWIPCEERLPREDELILVNVIHPDRVYPIILCIGKDAYAMAEHGDINAWMPLPKSYEGRTE